MQDPTVPTRLAVGVPEVLRTTNPASGTGTMWRHVLAGLDRHVELTFRDPAHRSRWWRRERPVDVWLTDCGLGPLEVAEPVVVQVHEAGWDDPEIRATFDPVFLAEVLDGRVRDAARAATRVVTPSVSSRAQVIRVLGVDADRVDVVSHGVDLDRFRPGLPGGREAVAAAGGDPARPYVLFVSQLHPRKNLASLATAMGELAASGWSHQLVVVGTPPQDRPERGTAAAPAGAVHLREVPEADLAALMAGATAFCLPSLMEGFGMTASEAMACGVPVVVSDRGSLPEVVGDAAVVVPPTVDALRAALAGIFEDPERAAALGAAARRRAETFTWEATTAGWLASLERAVSRGRAGR